MRSMLGLWLRQGSCFEVIWSRFTVNVGAFLKFDEESIWEDVSGR